ncbi:MAG: hypothetical protein HY815_06930 [Candidatus Riflebacteria bacterium]|nr:hypothetical protein [Candidatus Riflebacteria bacterium]
MPTRQVPVRRAGMIIPIVLVVLIVMAILGVVLMFSSSSEYSQSALVAYGVRARELALAALEEANAAVYDKVNWNGGAAPEWRDDLFTQAKAKADANDRTTFFPKNLLTLNLVPRSVRVASSSGGEIRSADVEFLGFKRMAYASTDTFLQDSIYYHDPDQKLDLASDANGVKAPQEYTGYYRVKVAARYGRVTRTVSQIHDVKIVQTVPPARDFALFSFLPTNPGQQNGPPDDRYANEDLNRGGACKVFAYGKGRVFVRGPFILESEGNPGGNGGVRPRSSSSYFQRKWWTWQLIPSTRDGIVTRAGPPLINFGVPPARPDRTSRNRWIVGIFTNLFGGLGELLGDDPGWYILDGQQWYCETRDPDPKSFSVTGDPFAGNPVMYRGVLTLHDGNNRNPVRDAEGDLTPNWRLPDQAPGDDEARWVVEPEGGLIGKYNVVKYSYSTYGWGLYEKYRVSRVGVTAARFGAHWEKKYEQSYWNRFFSDLFQAGTMMMFLGGAGLVAIPGLAPMALGALTIPGPVVLATLGAMIGMSLTGSTGFTNLGSVNVADLKDVFPPDFRIVARCVTRRYPKLKDLRSVTTGNPVRLDGIVALDDLSCDRAFRYTGKGYLYSDEPTAPPKLTAPISPVAAPPSDDYLTLYYGGGTDQPYQGSAMMEMKAAASGDSTVVGSVYATQGVKPQGSVQIVGNMSCGFVNKAQIPDASALQVHYRFDTLRPADRAVFRNGSWHAVAISQRSCLALDW